ncbi:hypothetical protein [Arthrobacter sp. A2-55]|uniref:hypothetical protein n=1 Tax=Arthrobacter sp. A2-55 TaxID=2897337 RepID=UPI0021CDCE47|nr:hypothetical protein [Arthrobacter sp. A2-55]MCU6479105.1 hypothetical protein [Arthrobacter sp. A2-55]
MNILLRITAWAADSTRRPALAWVLATAVAAIHILAVFSIPFTPSTFVWLYPLAIIAPGAATMILLPGAWRRWYRWAALLALSFNVYPDILPAVLFVGECWALHQSWAVERHVPLKGILTFRHRPRPATTVA